MPRAVAPTRADFNPKDPLHPTKVQTPARGLVAHLYRGLNKPAGRVRLAIIRHTIDPTTPPSEQAHILYLSNFKMDFTVAQLRAAYVRNWAGPNPGLPDLSDKRARWNAERPRYDPEYSAQQLAVPVGSTEERDFVLLSRDDKGAYCFQHPLLHGNTDARLHEVLIPPAKGAPLVMRAVLCSKMQGIRRNSLDIAEASCFDDYRPMLPTTAKALGAHDATASDCEESETEGPLKTSTRKPGEQELISWRHQGQPYAQ